MIEMHLGNIIALNYVIYDIGNEIVLRFNPCLTQCLQQTGY
jgi:hypothetical protein